MASIVKAHILGADERGVDAAGRSTQLPEDTWDYDKTGAKEPPYNLDALCLFLEINTWHYRCVKAKAISTAGLGYDFVVPEGVKDSDPAHKRALQEFFGHPNDEMTWGEILENALTDFEALGNGYFEVVRNRFGTGAPKAIYHVPAVTMRVRKDKKGFIQRRDNKVAYFRNFGSDPKDPDSFDPRDRDKPPGKRRLLNEVIHLKNYHPRSSYYGLPDFLRLVLEKRPAIVVLENVPLLESAPEFARVVEVLRGAGYAVDWRILNAADYGVPQTRRRLFLIALRDEKRVPARAWPFPTHTRHTGLFTDQWISAGSVLLPLLEMREPDLDRLPRWIASRWTQLPRHLRDEVLVHPQLSARNSSGRRDRLHVRPLTLPAFTVTASAAGTRYAHIVHDGQYWRVRPQEMATLQGLPYLPEMTAKHIGNAVPPLLAQRLGEALKLSLIHI